MTTKECPACYQQIDAEAAECPNCKTILVSAAPLPPSQPSWRRIAGPALGGIAGMALYHWYAEPGDSAARNIVRQSLVAPSTAKFLKSDPVLTRDSWRLSLVVVDAQNQFGAMLRNTYCVVYEAKGNEYTWRKSTAMSPCSDPPTAVEIDLAKSENHWPKE